MLKIVNQTTYTIEYNIYRVPASQHIGQGIVKPNMIAAYRIDEVPPDNHDALNCEITTYRKDSDDQIAYLETLRVPANSTIVYSTQIVTGLLRSS